MKTIKIYIQDNDKIGENDDLGFDKNKGVYNLIDFYFDETQLLGYWVDPEIDTKMGTQNIIFYLGGTSFSTPLTLESEIILKSCLNLGL
jgi:hypothetical protein